MCETKKKRILKVSPIVFDLNNYVMGEAIYRKWDDSEMIWFQNRHPDSTNHPQQKG